MTRITRHFGHSPATSFLASNSPRLRGFFCALALTLPWLTCSAQIIERHASACNFADTQSVLVDQIEAAGLNVAAINRFGDMLKRTGPGLGQPASPYREALIVQFCSARVSWRMVLEDAGNIALCPLSIALYQPEDGGGVQLVYRLPDPTSEGRQAAIALLRELAGKTVQACAQPRPATGKPASTENR